MSIQSVERRQASRGWCAEAVSRFLILILALSFSVAHAATFTVTNLNDSGPGSLRQAVLDANAAAGADTIVFLAGLNGTLRLLSGRITITDSLTINGPGADLLAISGNNASQIFYINGSGKTFIIDGLTFKEGGNTDYGGAIQVYSGTLTLSNSTLSRNSARRGGGGISNIGTLIIQNSILAGNTMTGGTSYGGGGIFNYRGTLTVIDSTLSGNTARAGGGIYGDGGALTVIDSTLFGNTASTHGGGIFKYRGALTVIDSTLSGNAASTRGGGIRNDDGALTVTDSTLSGNTAGSNGGGIDNSGGQQKTVTNSTLSGNTAQQNGGGIYNYRTPLTVINSTLSGNTAQQNGGGIYGDGGTTTAINSTLSGNSADSYGGGGFFTGTLRVGNSIVAGNVTLAPGSDVFMSGDSTTFDSQGHNLFSVNGLIGAAPVANDLILTSAIDTAIGPLADNGGPTTTHLPVPGSPVIDAGDNALIPADITTDQRGTGFPRIVGGTVDIGAVEFGGDGGVTTHALTVGKSGGNGTITSNPAGINCGATCSANFNSGTAVTLTASADSGYSFTGWSGDCNGTTCTVTMDRSMSVIALFASQTPDTHTLTTTTAGPGSGMVGGAGSYAAGAMVNLTATPSAGSTFASWSPSPCAASFAMPANNLTCTATFTTSAPNTYPLTLTTAGSGSGTVGGAGSYAAGAMVALTATPNAGSTFVGWSPSPCASLFSMPANALICTANFTGPTSGGSYPLTVALAGTGVGSIASQPSGIRCSNIPGDSSDCSETYPANTAVTLTPTLATGASYFAGWSGACTGTGPCTVTMSGPQSVTATLATGHALTVIRNEGGTVTRSPAGSNCTTAAGGITEQCIYAPNTAVTLTAVPANNNTFGGWTGACSGIGPCTVTMTANQTVTAAFTSRDPVTSLITHYYQSITERAPDPGGLTFWQGLVAERQANNQDVKEVFRQIADFFFNSEEYIGRNTTDRQFITNLYLTFFQRAPDEGGYAFWLGQLAQGMSRNQAMRGFLYSPEFTDFMERTLNP